MVRPISRNDLLAIILIVSLALAVSVSVPTAWAGSQPRSLISKTQKERIQKKAKKQCRKRSGKAKRVCVKRKLHRLQKKAEIAARKGPSGIQFYYPPSYRVTGEKPGQLIWSRPANNKVSLKNAKSTERILYTSKNPKGKTVAVSGSISLPKGKAPKGGWPVISYGHGTTGIADKCAPSRDYKGSPTSFYIDYVDPELNTWLKQGYAVLRTDYQGLGTKGVHPYLVGVPEGRSIIDIVRAGKKLHPSLSKNYIVSGHSQGGHAALWAAGLASKRAPGFRLKGVVSYAPGSHMKEQVSLLPLLTDPSSITAYGSITIRGAETQNKAIIPASFLNPPILSFYPDTLAQCIYRLAEPDSLGGIAPSTMMKDGANIAPLLNTFKANNPAVKTDAPILLLQGLDDPIVFPALTAELNSELNARGDKVTYLTYPGVNHGDILPAAQPVVTDWMAEKLPAN